VAVLGVRKKSAGRCGVLRPWLNHAEPAPIVEREIPAASNFKSMESTTKESSIMLKTIELCQAVVEQPDFQAVKQKLDAFMSDELVKYQFQQVNDLGDLLQAKQRDGLELKAEEIAKFDELRGELMKNPVALGFLDAQQEMQKLHEAIGCFVNKTFELGRRPEYEDVYDGSCSSCSCH
jgi:cell fate (sporulation/competence/biofilm development) regulator YlbF (YheA/YmcA/DUF963 family)